MVAGGFTYTRLPFALLSHALLATWLAEVADAWGDPCQPPRAASRAQVISTKPACEDPVARQPLGLLPLHMSASTPPASPPTISPNLQAALGSIEWVRIEFEHELLDDLDTRPGGGQLPFIGDQWRSMIGARLPPATRNCLFQLDAQARRSRLPPWCLQPPIVTTARVPAGTCLAGALTLFNGALAHADACMEAISKLHQLTGAGGHTPLRCVSLTVRRLSGQHVDSPASARISAWDAFRAGADEPDCNDSTGAQVWLVSPLYLSQGPRRLMGPPPLDRLVRACLARVQGLAPPDLPGGLYAPDEAGQWLAWASTVRLLNAELDACGQPQHYSYGQRRTYPVVGDSGRLLFDAPAALAWPWLRLAQHLQVGSNVTHGLGVIGLSAYRPPTDPV